MSASGCTTRSPQRRFRGASERAPFSERNWRPAFPPIRPSTTSLADLVPATVRPSLCGPAVVLLATRSPHSLPRQASPTLAAAFPLAKTNSSPLSYSALPSSLLRIPPPSLLVGMSSLMLMLMCACTPTSSSFPAHVLCAYTPTNASLTFHRVIAPSKVRALCGVFVVFMVVRGIGAMVI